MPQSEPPSVDLLRPVGLWTADCAERVLPIFEANAPSDRRPHDAIDAVRAFGRGGRRGGALRTSGWAAHAAARDVGDPAATSAARAACLAAASAYTHLDVQTAHQIKHVLGPAVYAAQARELAAGGDSAVGDEEISWAIAQVPPQVRTLVEEMIPPAVGRSRLSALFQSIDAGIRG